MATTKAARFCSSTTPARRPARSASTRVVANPEVDVEIGTKSYSARARVAEGGEREAIWEKQKQDWPGFADYEEKTTGIREIPVVILDLET